MFTKVASASESGLQVTHNGANYPVEYAIYEFAAGASNHSRVSTTGSGTLPTLSGLPGANMTVLAAQSRQLTFWSTYPLVTTWRGFWRTSVNRNTLDEGISNGSFFNVGYFAFNDFPDAVA